MSQDEPQPDSRDRAKRIFLLTKPPQSVRAGLCRRLMEQSRDAILYLAGDGVYNLAGESLSALPGVRIIACREDLEARGIRSDGRTSLPVDFYGTLMDEIMNQNSRVFTF